MPTITYRKLDENNDPLWGQGQANFLSDLEATAQAILTRVRLFQGEWWANLLDGTPMWQSIMGASASDANRKAITQLIVQRISETPFVLELLNLTTSFEPTTRKYNFSVVVKTQFGILQVTNQPTFNAA